MDQSFHTVLQANEGTEINDIGDNTAHPLTDSILIVNHGPGVGQQPTDAQTNLPLLSIEIQDGHVHFLAHADDLTGMPDRLPRQLGNMHKTVHPAQIHESPEIGQAAHGPVYDLALSQCVDQLTTPLLAPLALGSDLRHHQPLAPPVNLNNLHHDVAFHLFRQPLDSILLRQPTRQANHLRCRHKAPQIAKRSDQSPFVETTDFGLVYLSLVQILFGLFPCQLYLSQIDGYHQIAVLVFGFDNVDRDFTAHRDLSQFLWAEALQVT